MALSNRDNWERFQKYYTFFPKIRLALDLSRMNFPDDFLAKMAPRMTEAFAEMAELERGAIANPDENRMVGHYWLRNPSLAPTSEIRAQIESALSAIKAFTKKVHTGAVKGAGGKFKQLLVIGIGGSALGPQFVAGALGRPGKDKLRPFFFDNTDPDGMDKVLAQIGRKLSRTLTIVISKSGGTMETRNGMVEAKAAYARAGLDFEQHAAAITGMGSELDRRAQSENWLCRFPMWDWVGGRTSELSTVGLLPAALQGVRIDELLAGARACDEVTRTHEIASNPAAQLALMWFYSDNGKGSKDMVILPYKDRLELFSRYLQQLVMESLGKELDRSGNVVNQGIAVYGNKGSTDQHAYVQQLRDGLNNFFVTFVEVLRERHGAESIQVEPGRTSGDYLSGFLLGTRAALSQQGRESITITIDEISPFAIGVLIAFYERAVGFYASLINVNAYHQPGVEAGKKAASEVLEIQSKIERVLRSNNGSPFTVEQLASEIGSPDSCETVFKVCEFLATNPDRRVTKAHGLAPTTTSYSAS